MKKILNYLTLIVILSLALSACEENEIIVEEPAASLSVVHAASGAPPVHVDYFGETIEQLDFSINPTLSFASSNRFVIPSNETRALGFTYASDTTNVVFEEEVTLAPGQIATYFLLGDSLNLSSRLIDDAGLVTFRDSTNAVRFINLAEGVQSLNIGIQDSTATVASSLAFGDATEFITVDATLENERYDFTFKNEADSTLTTLGFDQWRVLRFGPRVFVFEQTCRTNVTLW